MSRCLQRYCFLVAVFSLIAVEALWPNVIDRSSGYAEKVPQWTFATAIHPSDVFDFCYPLLLICCAVISVGLFAAGARTKHKGGDLNSSLADQWLGTIGLGAFLLMGWVLLTAKMAILPWSCVPPPAAIIRAFAEDFEGNGALYQQLIARGVRTGFTMFIALVLAVPAAIICGLILGSMRALSKYVTPYVELLSPLPPVVLFPLVNLLFSPLTVRSLFHRDRMPFWFEEFLTPLVWIVVSMWAIFWPVFAASFDAAKYANGRLGGAADLVGVSFPRKLRSIILPQATNQIYANLPIAIIMGMIVLLFAQSEGGEIHPRTGLIRLLFVPTLGSLLSTLKDRGEMAPVLAIVVAVLLLVLFLLKAVHLSKVVLAPWLRESSVKSEPGLGSDGHVPVQFSSSALTTIQNFKREFDSLVKHGDPSARGTLVLDGLQASFGAFGIGVQHLTIKRGEFISIIGESGGGKSTLVEVVAGLRKPTSLTGRIMVNGLTLYDNGPRLLEHPSTLGVSFVHQDFALFPQMAVEEQLHFYLNAKVRCLVRYGYMRRADGERVLKEKHSAIKAILEFLGLDKDADLLRKYPKQLSGGQQQRVALARALLINNPILVMDEALSSIDQPAKGDIRDGIRRLNRDLQLTILAVSHDNQDVLRISDRIVYMERSGSCGSVVTDMSPTEFYYRPVSAKAARFIGHRNLYWAKLELESGTPTLLLALRKNDLSSPQAKIAVNCATGNTGNGIVMIPSTWINPHIGSSAGANIVGTVIHECFLGGQHELIIQVHDGLEIQAVIQDDDYRDFLEAVNSSRATPITHLSNSSLPLNFRISGAPHFIYGES